MTAFFVICFDVRDKRRLRRVSNEMENFGMRVQRSVFECHLNDHDLNALKARLSKLIDDSEDHVRYYTLCPKDRPQILVEGDDGVTVDYDYHLL